MTPFSSAAPARPASSALAGGDPLADRLALITHDLLAVAGADRRLIWTNPAWQPVLDWTAGELAARSSEPLRMVPGYLQLLRSRHRGKLNADADEFIDFAVDGAGRPRRLIDDLLTYSRAGRDDQPLAPLHVADNGIGLEPALAERIFRIFQRLHTRDDYPGTGIGLAIATKVIERHDGGIWAEPAPGSGTRFHFTLPAGKEASP